MKKKLHILFLSSWYPTRVSPTRGDFVQRHAEAVATLHKVTIVHLISDKRLRGKIELSETKNNNIETKIIYVPHTKNPAYKFMLFFNTYLKTIKRIDFFDIVHLNVTFPVGVIALYLKWLKKKPFIISEHWTGYQKQNIKSIGILRKLVTKIIVKNASFVCPVTKNLQNNMMIFGLKGNYCPVPNVVDTNYFNISENIIKKFTVTHISHMGNEHKNVEGILNVISKLESKIPHLKFNLIGENSEKYISLIHKLRIKNVTIIDQIPNIEIGNYLNKSSVFVLFSNYENLPCVILESFACGTPVISTNVGGISEYFPKNFGYLIKPKDEISLENTILKIYNKKLNYNKKLMHNYALDNFGVQIISLEFTKLYTKTLSN
ncbi:hypothetical protein Lupro_05175 [Lutibacter profundi]|uniref:Glycosyl transferase family 1 domain-containing protein n=1 Tax=Lutibacter profundi TaxID=1622118 RepID=A0A0X8G608_9FLAO|nr:glycosyltransferase [Lutibacter profundi]AMC10670.1 hypothetical protein Lupro_05175 [Lutibacter profundi]